MGEMGEREKENKKDVWAYGATATLYAGATWDCAVAAELEAGNGEMIVVGGEARTHRRHSAQLRRVAPFLRFLS